ncbi:MAG TPA: phosphate regulon transcriptional regulatory protein PhoB [Gammaproteobacteria bacterium]|nr:phosphate regulon transcriptional regulatory protein PhoB [Gammaproteobacteria bacterium]
MKATILLVEDETAIREMLRYTLTREGFEVIEAGDAREGERLIASVAPDLLLLDWMLPGLSGVELARRLRRSERTRRLPIIMLTARGDEENRIQGLEEGADDYVTKPFSPRELVARIRALLRRSGGDADTEGPLETEGLALDPASHRVTANGVDISLGPTEYRLLHFFMAHPERVFSRNQLLDQVWGDNVYIEERTIDVHIRRLRKALEKGGHDRLIQTVRGAGYRFSTQV